MMIDWELIKRKLEGSTTPEEEKRIQQWLNENDSNRDILQSLSKRWIDNLANSESSEFNANQAFNEFRRKVEISITVSNELNNAANDQSNVIPLFRRLAVAASIVLLMVAGWYFNSLSEPRQEIVLITKSTTRGQKANITLPDGSTIRLNSESSITYPERFSLDQRNISLQGEGFFEVTEDSSRPFTVKTGELSTQVLGTSFNISAFPEHEDIQVTVVTGKVKVIVDSDQNGGQDLPSSEGIVLTPGFQSTYSRNNNTLNRAQVEVDKFFAWKDGIIDFDDIPLRDALDYLERWFDVEINSEKVNLSNCYIKSTYTTQSLENIFESLNFINGLEFEKNDKLITITKSNCQ